VTDTAGVDNALTVRQVGTDVVMTDAAQAFAPGLGVLSDGGRTLTLPTSAFTGQVVFNAGAGNDVLTVDDGGGFLQAGILYDGGAGGNDGLVVKGDGATTSAQYGPDAASKAANKKGTVRLSSGAGTADVTFSNLEPVDVTGM